MDNLAVGNKKTFLAQPSVLKRAIAFIIDILVIDLIILFPFKNMLENIIGKKLLNLYVESQTKELKYWQLLVRSMFLIPLFPFVLLWVIDPIVMLFTKDSQRLSEILSKTKVVERYKI